MPGTPAVTFKSRYQSPIGSPILDRVVAGIRPQVGAAAGLAERIVVVNWPVAGS